ncbi:MAG TPA: cell division protein ZapA [Bacteroidales bacterium]|nr:cell division protein ZapA [Bacteroidales bacterium]
MSELSISITLADRPYKLVIDNEQEELFRRSAKLIDKKIKEYSSNYAYKDKQDLLAMVALEFVVGSLQNEQKTTHSEQELDDKLIGINKALDEVLNSPAS